ncbi:hypothetical protein [Thermomonospora cellulosilytica]|uniref:Uncharacterized protein n=1 Tax=Thermomonospora cellulosilytica TaxID=1411118 RepID=A0A7W3R8L2_9ACTN|nr:hypothetical protein [Thermomonospora cellulosilytica]MBA9003856.1 hypothetical protein [Thermomonospora cellulosilytica]
MELRLASRVFGAGDLAIWLTGSIDGAEGIPEGVDIVTSARPAPAGPGPVVAMTVPAPAYAAPSLYVGDELAEEAAKAGAGLVCRDPRRALEAGVRPDGLIVDAGPRPSVQRVEDMTKDGLAVLVRLDDEPVREDSGLLAAASVYAWLGVRVFAVAAPDVPAVRQVLDMVAAIKGDRPPTLARRGLA